MKEFPSLPTNNRIGDDEDGPIQCGEGFAEIGAKTHFRAAPHSHLTRFHQTNHSKGPLDHEYGSGLWQFVAPAFLTGS
jgi:hypothetical protein